MFVLLFLHIPPVLLLLYGSAACCWYLNRHWHVGLWQQIFITTTVLVFLSGLAFQREVQRTAAAYQVGYTQRRSAFFSEYIRQ